VHCITKDPNGWISSLPNSSQIGCSFLCRKATRKDSCLVDPVAGWGCFISKCWMKRSKCRCTKDQFTNETWVLSATVLLVSWIFLESSVLLTQVFFKMPFYGIPWGCTHVLCGSPTVPSFGGPKGDGNSNAVFCVFLFSCSFFCVSCSFGKC